MTTVTDPSATVPPPAKKPRKPRGKPKPPAAPKVERARKPRRSILGDIAALGPTHLAAYRSLAQGNPQFTRDIVSALGASKRVELAHLSVIANEHALAEANERLIDAKDDAESARKVLASLDSVAKSIAHARGEVPAVETPTPLLDPDGRDEGAET